MRYTILGLVCLLALVGCAEQATVNLADGPTPHPSGSTHGPVSKCRIPVLGVSLDDPSWERTDRFRQEDPMPLVIDTYRGSDRGPDDRAGHGLDQVVFEQRPDTGQPSELTALPSVMLNSGTPAYSTESSVTWWQDGGYYLIHGQQVDQAALVAFANTAQPTGECLATAQVADE